MAEFDLGRVTADKLIDPFPSLAILLFKKRTIIVIVHQRGVHVRNRQLREFANNFFRRHAPKIMPDMDVPYSNPGARNARLAATYRGIGANMASLDKFASCCVHWFRLQLSFNKNRFPRIYHARPA